MFLINKKCVCKEKMSSYSENVVALILINNINYSKNNKTKKKTKKYFDKTIAEKQEQEKCIYKLIFRISVN